MKRHCFQLLHELLSLFPCVAIIGVRQCGKTTLLKELSGGWNFFDLEKNSDYQVIAQDPDLFFRLNTDKVILDESQLLPKLFPALRVAIDNDRHKCGRFILSGSSSPELIKSISESLAGRIAVIELAPFSLTEAAGLPQSPLYKKILDSEPLENFSQLTPRISIQDIHTYWLRGGYPEPWIKDSPRFTKLWQQNYFQTYLNRDVLRMFPGLNAQKYTMFLQLLANLSGNIINYSDAARILGISQPTAREYFHIAHGTFTWRHIPPYEKNAVKRIIKHPKGYLRDTGLLHFLLHLPDTNALLTHPAMGHSWEAMVIENIIRGFNALGAAFEYFHYRTSGGAEIDLILEGDFGLIPVEIKYTQSVNPRELRSLRDFIMERDCHFGIVINNDERVRLYDQKIIGIPASCL